MKTTPFRISLAPWLCSCLLTALAGSTLVWAHEGVPHTAGPVRGKTISISEEDIEHLMSQQDGRSTAVPEQRQRLRVVIVETLIQDALLSQNAEQEGLDHDPELQRQMRIFRNSLLSRIYMQRLTQRLEITPAMIEAEYARMRNDLQGTEAYVRRMSFIDEQNARRAENALRKGEDFAQVSKRWGTPQVNEKPGELRWLDLRQLPEPIWNEVKAQIQKPVATRDLKLIGDSGMWHIVQVRTSRPSELPELSQVREQIEYKLRNEYIRQFLSDRRVAEGFSPLK